MTVPGRRSEQHLPMLCPRLRETDSLFFHSTLKTSVNFRVRSAAVFDGSYLNNELKELNLSTLSNATRCCLMASLNGRRKWRFVEKHSDSHSNKNKGGKIRLHVLQSINDFVITFIF